MLALVVRAIFKRYCSWRCSRKNSNALQTTQENQVTSDANTDPGPRVVQVTTFGSLTSESTPRRCRVPSQPVMQTLFEEEESQGTPSEGSGTSLNNEEIGVVYAIYTFPRSSLNHDIIRSCAPRKVVSGSRREDQPPSYEDLFPIKSDDEVTSVRTSPRVKKYSLPNAEVRVNIEPAVHRSNSSS